MTIIRNILAIIVGIAVGVVVNLSLVMLGPLFIPPPAGVDMTNTQSVIASIHLFEPKHFVFPFLAHALGTLVGALTAFLIARSHGAVLAYVVCAFSLASGFAFSYMSHRPTWFIVLDLLFAYIPMAWIGTVIGRRIKGAVAAPVQNAG